MNTRLLSAEDVLAKLADISNDRIKAVLREAFTGLLSGRSLQPVQTVTIFPGNEGDCIFYPAALWDTQLIGVKVSPYLPALGKTGQYPVTAYTMLVSGRTGEPLLVCDSLALTTARTAATTSLALEFLIPPSARVLTVIGAGKVGLAHLKFLTEQHAWHEVRVFSPSLKDESTAKGRARRTALDRTHANATIATSAQTAVEGADVVVLCTSSGTPVIETGWLQDHAVVASISTSVPLAHEIAPSELGQYAVFCDYRQTAPASAGEMVLARDQCGWSETRIVADLPELVAGKHPGAKAIPGKAFFRSVGLGIEDLAIASLLL